MSKSIGTGARYVGTKHLLAWPMTRGDYNKYRGWDLPGDENPDDAGYLVEYEKGGEPNHPEHAGYISWSPRDVFEGSYTPDPYKEDPQQASQDAS